MKLLDLSSNFALLTLALGASAAFAQPNTEPTTVINPPQRRVRPTDPALQITQDLTDFAAALNGEFPFPLAQKWIYDARFGFFGANEWLKNAQHGKFSLVVDKVVAKPINAETATATVTYHLAPPPGVHFDEARDLGRERDETLSLRLNRNTNFTFGGGRIWQIVAPDALPHNLDDLPGNNLLATFTYFLAQRQSVAVKDLAPTSLSHLKQLALGVQMFTLDYDDLYAFAPAYLPDALQPYLKTKDVFFVPGSDEIFRFNPNLGGKSTQQIAKPDQTVLFYEGADEKPTFRYDGRAAIAFADGHVALISPGDSKTLIWKP